MAAMAIGMESSWREDRTKDEAFDLIQRLIGVGLFTGIYLFWWSATILERSLYELL